MSNLSISSTRVRRRLFLAALYGVTALGVGMSLAAAPARPAATAPRPATPAAPAANKAGAEAQFEKAKALYDQNNYAEAQVENEKALAMDPTNSNATLLKRVLATKINTTTGPGTTTQAGATGTAGRLNLLNTQQISLIRLMELGPDDRRPVGRVDPKTLDAFWDYLIVKETTIDKSKASHDAFVNPANFPNQVREIRKSNDAKFMSQVTLTTDPAVLTNFRSTVNNLVLQNCATSECHGGDRAGNFRLIASASTIEQQYTNFYILASYANADGKMIDRDNPEKSLLLQYGLPWANAAYKHPKAEVRKFTGSSEPRFRSTVDWIKSLAFPKPNYQITYEIPGGSRPASAPATTPATAPATTTASQPAGK